MEKPTLGYWKIRALGAHLKMLLEYAGVDYENREYEIYKKADGGYDMTDYNDERPTLGPFPNIPYFKDGDYLLTETGAVTRYIAAKWAPHLCGSTPEVSAMADMLYSIWHPIRFSKLTLSMAMGCADKEMLRNDVRENIKPLHNWLAGKKWLCGEELTWVDFYAYEAINIFQFVWEGRLFEEFPLFIIYQNEF
jgi:glutathione S-transferase